METSVLIYFSETLQFLKKTIVTIIEPLECTIPCVKNFIETILSIS